MTEAGDNPQADAPAVTQPPLTPEPVARHAYPPSPRPGLVRSLGWAFSGNLLSRAAIVLFTLIAAASLPAENFATLVGLQAAALMAAATWDLGLTTITTRELAAGHIELAGASRRLLRLRLETAPLGVVAFAMGLWLLGRAVALDPLVVMIMAVLAVLVGVEVLLVAVLNGRMDFRESSLATSVGRWTAVFATAAILILPGQPLAIFAAALCLGEIVAIAVAADRLRRGRDRASSDRMAASVVLSHRAALPFAANSLIQFAYNRLDVLIVAAVSSAAVMGAYAPASRVQDALLLVAAAAGAVMLPTAARHYTEETDSAREARTTWVRVAVLAVLVSLALSAVVWLTAPQLIPALLGDTYTPAVSPIRIIVWSVPLIAFNSVLAAVVNARRQPYYVTAAIAAAAVTAILLIVALVPSVGADGAALAATVRELPVGLILLVGAHRTGLFRRHTTESDPERLSESKP